MPGADEPAWRKCVERALGGASPESLAAKTRDGVSISPVYPTDLDAGLRALRAQPDRWLIGSRVDHPDPAALIDQANIDLAEGADCTSVVCSNSPGAFGFGLADWSRRTADQFFSRVEFGRAKELEIDCSPDAVAGVSKLISEWTAAASRSGAKPLRFLADPILADFSSSIEQAVSHYEQGAIAGAFCADGRSVHAAGGSEAQELAVAVAGGVLVLRDATQSGASLDQARGLLSFKLAADADFILTMVKTRALRFLWAWVEEACGLSARPIWIGAETAWRMMTRRDPWTNVLRSTIATAAASLGGADAIVALPFTQALGLPDAAARRLARNTQLVLLHEAHLAKTEDPAAGAGAFDELSKALCLRAWALFQSIEREGGLRAALRSGFVQREIIAVRDARRRDVVCGIEQIVGTSAYPDSGEQATQVLAALGKTPPHGIALDLPLIRASEPFERFRDASDAWRDRTGARPRVCLVNCAATAERLAFAKNLFETGGFEAIECDDFELGDEGRAALQSAGAEVACLCPGRSSSTERLVAMAHALAAAGARRVYIAARPGPDEAALRQAGIAGFLHPECDAIEILESAYSGAA